MKPIKHTCYLFMVLAAGLCFSRAYGLDVILNPGYIQGTVSVEGVAASSVDIRAAGCSGHESKKTIHTDNYNLTVHVVGDSCDYNVSCTVYSDNGRDRLYFQSRNVTVSDGGTSTADFSLAPGFVSGTISISGGSVKSGQVKASGPAGGGYTNAYTSVASDGTFSFPVQPNTGIKLSGYVRGADGVKYSLEEVDVNVNALGTVVHDWSIVPGDGVIKGSCSLDGITTDKIYLRFYGPDNSSAHITADAGGSYETPKLLPGLWTISLSMIMNGWDDHLYLPESLYTNTVTVPPGGTAENYITIIPSVVTGRVTVKGSKGIGSVYSGQVSGIGIYGNDSSGGYGDDDIDPSSGDFDLILTRGDWNVCYLDLDFYEPGDPFLYSRLYYTDYSKHAGYGTGLSLSDNGLVEHHNFIVGTGTATVNFEVEGGGLFSNPWLEGGCYTTDSSGQLETSTSIKSEISVTDATHAGVTFVGTPGTYDITARADVDGSETTFGQLGVVIVEGTDVRMDIGAPELTVTAPEPYFCAGGTLLTVSGISSDSDGIADVRINGADIPFAAANRSEGESEIAFSSDIPLAAGPNRIETAVTDTKGKTIIDSRTVYYDLDAPRLAWTPADGASVSHSQVMVAGTASDDCTVSAILVNGAETLFLPTANDNDPNEVAFATPLQLDPGVHQITVDVADGCGGTVSHAREITVDLPCEAVDDLRAMAKSRKVQLMWTPKGGQSYNIHRSTSGGAHALIATSGAEYCTYIDTDVTDGTPYSYHVRTVCDGVVQTPSNEAAATPSRRTR